MRDETEIHVSSRVIICNNEKRLEHLYIATESDDEAAEAEKADLQVARFFDAGDVDVDADVVDLSDLVDVVDVDDSYDDDAMMGELFGSDD